MHFAAKFNSKVPGTANYTSASEIAQNLIRILSTTKIMKSMVDMPLVAVVVVLCKFMMTKGSNPQLYNTLV